MALCFNSVVLVTQHRNAVSHDFYVSSFLLSPSILLGYPTRGPRKSPLLSPFHFTHFPSLPVHVEQGRAVAVVGIRHVSSPQRPSPFGLYTCVRTIQLSWAMTSDKHFGIFLCLTALCIDTNLVPCYVGFYTLFVY